MEKSYTHTTERRLMINSRMAWLAIAVLAACLGFTGISSAATEEQEAKWKWVDANEDCVDTCDKKKYDCPCVIPF